MVCGALARRDAPHKLFSAPRSARFGAVALSALLAEDARAAAPAVRERNPLAPRSPHFRPRAKRVIFLFMHGGVSQVDTFDYKPLLERDHGKPLPFPKPRVVSAETGNLLRSPFAYAFNCASA